MSLGSVGGIPAMYVSNEEFEQADENDTVWRYMSLTKFVWLLHSKSLYFARADKLDDPFEGSYPLKNISKRNEYFDSLRLDVNIANQLNELQKNISRFVKKCVTWTAVNCWHLSNHESAAMWRLYVKEHDGVAIRSSYGRLKECFKSTSEHIFIGMIKYIDYEKECISRTTVFSPFLHKRKSFEHEREVRAVISNLPIKNGGLAPCLETIDHGVKIELDLSVLVERIYVAPSAPTWIHEVVRSITKSYGYSFDIKQSGLSKDAVY
jgi:hypothetical protein